MAETAFDPINQVAPRVWSNGERRKLTRALIRHARKDDMRPELRGIHFDGDAAIATDGHRLLCVRGIADPVLSGKTLVVSDGVMEPCAIDAPFPDWRKSLPQRMGVGDRRFFALRDALEVRRAIRKNFPVSFTEHGLVIGAAWSANILAAIQSRFIADLPSTDDLLIVSMDAGVPAVSAIVISPEAGGWFAAIMPTRVDHPPTLSPWAPSNKESQS